MFSFINLFILGNLSILRKLIRTYCLGISNQAVCLASRVRRCCRVHVWAFSRADAVEFDFDRIPRQQCTSFDAVRGWCSQRAAPERDVCAYAAGFSSQFCCFCVGLMGRGAQMRRRRYEAVKIDVCLVSRPGAIFTTGRLVTLITSPKLEQTRPQTAPVYLHDGYFSWLTNCGILGVDTCACAIFILK